MAALSVSAIGVLGAFPVFWAIPAGFLTGTAAAGGIAFINSVGNLAGFATPFAMGWMKEWTGGVAAGLYVVAAMQLTSTAIVALAMRRLAR